MHSAFSSDNNILWREHLSTGAVRVRPHSQAPPEQIKLNSVAFLKHLLWALDPVLPLVSTSPSLAQGWSVDRCIIKGHWSWWTHCTSEQHFSGKGGNDSIRPQ